VFSVLSSIDLYLQLTREEEMILCQEEYCNCEEDIYSCNC